MPKNILNIHDKFTKTILSDKEMAIAFIEGHLPKDIIELLNLQSLEYLNTSYLTKEMKNAFSDLVMNICLKNGEKVKICILLEHKSYIEPLVAFQILKYLGLAYNQQIKEKKQFELILPILYYHGKDNWEYLSLADHFQNFPDILKKYLPNFNAEFIDLKKVGKNHIELLGNGLLQTALLSQLYYYDSEGINSQIYNILKNLEPYLQSNLSYVIFVYLIQNKKLKKGKIIEILETLPQHLNEKVMSIYDELIREGIEKGKLEGKLEGIQEGIEKGKLEGVQEGIEKTILNAFDNGIALEIIRIISGENIDKINEVLKRNGRV